MSEADLIRLAQDGNPEAFGELLTSEDQLLGARRQSCYDRFCLPTALLPGAGLSVATMHLERQQ
jgi:hypothetical protein